MASEPRLVVGLRNGTVRAVTLCQKIGRAKSLATYLRGLRYEVRILNAADVLTLAIIPEPDSEVRLKKSSAKFKTKALALTLKQMRSPSRMAQ